MTTPLEKLYAAALENRRRGHKVITLDYVIQMIEQEASTRLVEAQEMRVRQSV